jgi:hypothetical protein
MGFYSDIENKTGMKQLKVNLLESLSALCQKPFRKISALLLYKF